MANVSMIAARKLPQTVFRICLRQNGRNVLAVNIDISDKYGLCNLEIITKCFLFGKNHSKI